MFFNIGKISSKYPLLRLLVVFVEKEISSPKKLYLKINIE